MLINLLYYIAHREHACGDIDFSKDLNDVASVLTVSEESSYYRELDTPDFQTDLVLLDFQWQLASSILSKGPNLFTCRALDVLRNTLVNYPDTNIIIVAAPILVSKLLPLYRDGVKSVLSDTGMDLLEVSDALYSVSCGKSFIIDQLTKAQKNYVLAVLDPTFSRLSDDDLLIVGMIVNKRTTEDIRIELNSKSIPAVRNRVSKILKTIGISKRSELIALAKSIGIVSTDA